MQEGPDLGYADLVTPTLKRGTKDGALQGLPFIAALVLGVLVFGLLADLSFGFPVLRSSRSWPRAALGTLGLGVLLLVGEAVGGWISGRDKVSDPLWRRVWHLGLLLGFAVVFAVIFGGIVWVIQ
jgi:hypothetical protein